MMRVSAIGSERISIIPCKITAVVDENYRLWIYEERCLNQQIEVLAILTYFIIQLIDPDEEEKIG